MLKQCVRRRRCGTQHDVIHNVMIIIMKLPSDPVKQIVYIPYSVAPYCLVTLDFNKLSSVSFCGRLCQRKEHSMKVNSNVIFGVMNIKCAAATCYSIVNELACFYPQILHDLNLVLFTNCGNHKQVHVPENTFRKIMHPHSQFNTLDQL